MISSTQSHDEPFFRRYTRLVTETDLVAALRHQSQVDFAELATVSDSAAGILHAPYTWTIRQVLNHLIDAERVFGYRAFRFSRGDQTPLSAFDEHLYVNAVDVVQSTVTDLVVELSAVRAANIAMFEHLTPSMWQQHGEAGGLQWTVTDLAQAILGHVRHHQIIIRKRLKIEPSADVREA